MVLLDFNEYLNMLTDSQYAKGVELYTYTIQLIPDNQN